MVDSRYVWLGVLLIVVGTGVYIRQMFRGLTRPNLVTWLLWALAPLIAFFAQLQEGVRSPAALTLAVGLCPAAIFVAGFRRAHVRITWFDLVCGAMSAVALALWRTTGNSKVAIVLSIVADVLAAVPTLVKSYRQPRSETPLVFALFMGSAGITLLTIRQWTLENSAFAIYIFVLYGVLCFLAQSRIGGRRHSKLPVAEAAAREGVAITAARPMRPGEPHLPVAASARRPDNGRRP